MNRKPTAFIFFICSLFMYACSVQKKINLSAKENIIDAEYLAAAHIGISLFDAGSGKYLYNYQGDKYFVPASNTKIPTCYAAMKYLGDSLAGIRYALYEAKDSAKMAVCIKPAGDPSFLHPRFPNQPVINFLQSIPAAINIVRIIDTAWQDEALGAGWSWDNYNDRYSAERSAFPVYGNTVKFIRSEALEEMDGFESTPVATVTTEPQINWDIIFNIDTTRQHFFIKRKKDENSFEITEGKEKSKEQEVPFVTKGLIAAAELLKDTILKEVTIVKAFPAKLTPFKTIYSQPVDAVLTPMMHNSDNFFAEQSLLMVSNERLGIMNDSKIIDTLLATDFKDLPQQPSWADGSGLSRYNLFTPQDFVAILGKMKKEFGMQRIKTIFPTGGEGTLSNYYVTDSSFIYAKTGTLSGVVALSGFLYTKKGKEIIFSVLVNNHTTSGTNVRRAVEKFLQGIRNKY